MTRTIRIVPVLCIVLILTATVYSEDVVHVPQTNTPPVIDGILDDTTWEKATKFENFKTIKPDYGKEPGQKTIAFMTYDAENLYVAFRCYDSEPDKIKTSVSNRDNMFQDDYVIIMLDTFNTMQEAFGFFLNPEGIQGDAMINADGQGDPSYDMVWYSKGTIDDEGWAVECRIPLQSIRFPGKETITIRVAIFRQITRSSEQLSFPPMYAEKGSILKQSQPLSVTGWKYKRVVEILPALTHSTRQSAKEGKMQTDEKNTDFSLTGKVGLTSDLTLDGTYNPDFSQVEADAGQIDINLRYELFYPEKRPFFLEGNDIFQFAGNVEEGPLGTVVHTRTIINPVFGLKLTGKLGRKSSLATIYALDDLPDDPIDTHPDFMIARYKFALKEDSYIGGFYTGKEYGKGFNRVMGADGRFRLTQTSIADFHIFGAFTQRNGSTEISSDHALGLHYQYGTRNVIIDLGYQDISQNFQVDTGYVTRTGIRRLSAFATYRFYPKSKFFQRIEPFYWSYHLYDTEYKTFETVNLFTLRFWLPRSTQFRVDALFANEVFAGERFGRGGLRFQTTSQITKHVFLRLFYGHTGSVYYDPEDPYQGYGNRLMGYIQFQPIEKLNFGLNIAYVDFFRKSDKKKIYDYAIIRSRNTFQANKYLFLRAILEYNSFRDRLTLDTLISFTYIPGTVIYAGYGSAFEKIEWDGFDYRESDNFHDTQRGYFFKVSYLWRF
ncbi:MAG: carbohydrate binding family 9 domain-containing protein [Candidatus Aminicenantes bacterium]|nr:MAG: carbohydrate binding family 9 domain-containing protein [Candidatus Aminicenantes bacterium]